MNTAKRMGLIVSVAGVLVAGRAMAAPEATEGTTAPASGPASADWPQFRGANRDGKSTETGLLKQWPATGPKLLWTAKNIGEGFSGVAIKDGLIYTTGDIDGQLWLFALDLNGTVKWKVQHGPAWGGQHPGSRATPTIDGDSLYLLSANGKLRSFNRHTGAPGWTVDVVRTFGGRTPQWGYAETALIDGPNLICTPGGPNACLVALNKNTGEMVWTSKGLSDPAGYASPILFEVGGIRQVANLAATSVVCVEAATGRFLWRYNRPSNRTANCPSPIFVDKPVPAVFAASGYNNGGGLVRVQVTGQQVAAAEAWETVKMVNHHGGMVIVDGYIYGNHQGGWSCLDLATGQQKYEARGVGKGSITYADGMLYTYSESNGTMGLVRATPEKYDQVSSFKVPSGGQGPYWAHPVVCGGRLYVRHSQCLYAYDIKAPSGAER